MENPRYWTTIHFAIHNAVSADADGRYNVVDTAKGLLEILRQHGRPATEKDVERVVAQYNKDMDDGIIGYSLPATIVRAFPSMMDDFVDPIAAKPSV
jgi:N-acyl-D-aspartate/D-glutamate deacylase